MRILTFDIEDWYHILDNPLTKTEDQWNNFEVRIHDGVDRILNLLQQHNQSATFFCLGWVGVKYPEIIKKIDEMGFEIATHSHYHQLVYELTPKQFKDDIGRSIKTLEDITGKKVRAFRAPGFSITPESSWAFEILIELGITIDCSVFPAPRAHGGFPDYGDPGPALLKVKGGTLKEFPINFSSIGSRKLVYSGGGYFRLFPQFLLNRFFKTSPYTMTYFHPRDFDFNQPMVPGLSTGRKFKSYVGLKSSLSKLSKLLGTFKFCDLKEAEERTSFDKTFEID